MQIWETPFGLLHEGVCWIFEERFGKLNCIFEGHFFSLVHKGLISDFKIILEGITCRYKELHWQGLYTELKGILAHIFQPRFIISICELMDRFEVHFSIDLEGWYETWLKQDLRVVLAHYSMADVMWLKEYLKHVQEKILSTMSRNNWRPHVDMCNYN